MYIESYVLPQIVTALDKHEAAQRAQRPATKSHGFTLRVSARTPHEAFHRAQFDVEVEQAKDPEKKESTWRKFTGIKKEEL